MRFEKREESGKWKVRLENSFFTVALDHGECVTVFPLKNFLRAEFAGSEDGDVIVLLREIQRFNLSARGFFQNHPCGEDFGVIEDENGVFPKIRSDVVKCI